MKLSLTRQLLACAGLLASAAAPGLAAEQDHWRVFVADHSAATVRAIDVGTGAVLATISTLGPAALQASKSGRTVFAVQSDADRVSAMASGVALDDHGDHGDLKVSQPYLLNATSRGARPVHFIEHDGQIAIFHDGDGSAAIVSEAQFIKGKLAPRDVKTASPHHGLAVPLGDKTLISIPDPQDPDALPIGMRLLDKDGKMLADHACPSLHGEASSGHLLAIACAKGLILVDTQKQEPQISFLPYPPSLPEGKATTLRGAESLRYFIGNYGPDAIILIDVSAREPFRLIKLPSRRVDFAIDPRNSERVYVFTEDGFLHRIDAIKGEITRSARLTEPYSMDGHWRDPRPRLAVAGEEIVVSDPLAGALLVANPETLAESRRIETGGMPYGLIAIGGAGEVH
ncbi:metallochaperone AztD [Phyllobacteriaceae bacterium SYSU D60012]|uniref:metallochaperone AztD n=1 Tax=Taklimakanibacter lacteus TaxID=2268456 RepID=UPI000E665D8B